MAEFDYIKIFKWILIVLLAGFIGQFGKSMAKHIMAKARSGKKELTDQTEEIINSTEGNRTGDRLEVKSPQPDIKQNTVTGEDAKQKKKLAKAMAKQKKKEAKTLEKQARP